MDPAIVPMMIFTVVVLMLIGGFILLLPLTRRLGALLEHRVLTEGKADRAADVEALARAVDALRDEVERLSDRQDFTEKLLERPRGPEA
jgi:cell division protein FtsB